MDLEEKMFSRMARKEKSEFLSLLKKAINGLEGNR